MRFHCEGEKATGGQGEAAGVKSLTLGLRSNSLSQETLHSCCFVFSLRTLVLTPSVTYTSGLDLQISRYALLSSRARDQPTLLSSLKPWLRWKASVYNAGDLGSIPGSGRFPGEGSGNPLQYSCLENPMDGGAWCRLLSMGSQRVGHE